MTTNGGKEVSFIASIFLHPSKPYLTIPPLSYADYDDDFTRRNRVEMENEANIKCTVTGRPELATFGGASVDLPYRSVTKDDVDECFERMWRQTQRVVQVRRKEYEKARLARLGQERGQVPQPPSPDPDNSARTPAIEREPPLSPEALREAKQKHRQRLEAMSRPTRREEVDWEPAIKARGFTFEPAMPTSGYAASLRKKMASSLPPVGPLPKRVQKRFLLAPPAGARWPSKKREVKQHQPPLQDAAKEEKRTVQKIVKKAKSIKKNKKKKKGGDGSDDDEDDDKDEDDDEDDDDDDGDSNEDGSDDDEDGEGGDEEEDREEEENEAALEEKGSVEETQEEEGEDGDAEEASENESALTTDE
jgi:hypothetical protein